MKQSSIKNLFFALIGGFLLGIPWIGRSLFFMVFLAWIPLFQLEEKLHDGGNPYALFNYAFAGFLLWNILGSWWITQAQWLGGALIMVANALVQAIVFWSASRVRTLLKIPFLFPFLLIWLGYEYFHNIWDLAWPWFNLGNTLITATKFIQWVEFTGVRGGSLWIILTNFAIFKACCVYRQRGVRKALPFLVVIPVLLLGPVLWSYQIFKNVQPGEETVKVALVQPNLDPYTEKFVPENQARHMADFFRTAEALCDDQTQYLFGPETLIVEQIDEENPTTSPYYRKLLALQKKYPKLNILVGVHSYRRLRDEIPSGSRFNETEGFHYEAFNTALFLAPGEPPQFYHKTKLVPIFERMPFVQYLGFLGGFSLELGGYNGTYSNRQESTHFVSRGGDIDILPIVCFESVFGPYCAAHLTEQKGFICMITNDGWWNKTPGFRHHFNFSPIRAIECRRDLVRVANNGISALIDARGTITAQTAWWQKTTLKGEVHLRSGRTFFARHGEWLGRTALVMGLFLIICSVLKRFQKKRDPS